MILDDPKRAAELEFWRGLAKQHGEYYWAYRAAEYHEKTKFFPSFAKQEGKGLDVGCGFISVFECSSKEVVACDILAHEYVNLLVDIYGKNIVNVPMYQMDSPDHLFSMLKLGKFDWVACLNMIDHTPDPKALIKEIHSVLVKGGKLYFEVHLEVNLHAPHYTIWSEHTVKEMFIDTGLFKTDSTIIQDFPEYNQRRLWVEFTKC